MNSFWVIEERLLGGKDWKPCTNHLGGEPNPVLLADYKKQSPHREFRIIHYRVMKTVYDGTSVVSNPV
jgi:hypothetical protein